MTSQNLYLHFNPEAKILVRETGLPVQLVRHTFLQAGVIPKEMVGDHHVFSFPMVDADDWAKSENQLKQNIKIAIVVGLLLDGYI